MTLYFQPSRGMTLGAELELQLLDAKTYSLRPVARQIFARLGGERPHIKHELFQFIVEINSGICKDVPELRRDLDGTLAELRSVCGEMGIVLGSCGTHPFAGEEDRLIYPSERYEEMAKRARHLVKRLVIFGLHVHIGVRGGDHAIAMVNAWTPYLPHLLALSASSPLWQEKDTGLASYRTAIFESLPTAGHPCSFSDWQDFERFYAAGIASGTLQSIKDIWWDIRPHPDFGTIEIRICDAIPTLGETMNIIALIHALSGCFDQRISEGWKPAPQAPWLTRENKWRASRWGMECDVVTDDEGHTAPIRDEILRLIGEAAPFAAELGCDAELKALRDQVNGCASYMRQRAWFAETKSAAAVAAGLVQEFATDRPILSIAMPYAVHQ